MSGLTLFGLFAVTAMLVFYAAEERNPLCILGFAAACALGSLYGFLQGAWPFGIVEAAWTAVAVQRWRLKRKRQRSVGSLRSEAARPERGRASSD